MTEYSSLLLDADGTLFDYARAEASALKHTFSEFGLIYDPRLHLDEYRRINDGLWLEFERGITTSEALRKERFRQLFGTFRLEVDPHTFSEAYLKNLAAANFLIDEAEQTCEYLSGKYELAILTNGIKHVQENRFRTSPLAKHIRHLIVSEDAGCQKPDPRIFDYAFQKLGLRDKHRALIVGDSLSSDIRGGANYGIDTVWYNPNCLPRIHGLEPTYEIRLLSELTRIL
jgi:2-haloacid dehalogenase